MIDLNVTGRSERVHSSDVMGIFQIAIEDVEAGLTTDFAFCNAVYHEVESLQETPAFLLDRCI